MKIHPTESQLHASVAELLDRVLIPPALFTTFPAGWGKLSKATAGRLYASGLKRGMPDIVVFIGRGRVIGLELKAYGRTLSEAQQVMHVKLAAAGVKVYTCKTLDDVLDALQHARVPMRVIGDLNASRADTRRSPRRAARRVAGGSTDATAADDRAVRPLP